MDLGRNGIGKFNRCFLKILGKQVYIIIKEFSPSENLLEKEIMLMQIRLEPKDVARLNTLGNNKCRKCSLELMEGDTVLRVGAKPTKYFHLECFKVY